MFHLISSSTTANRNDFRDGAHLHANGLYMLHIQTSTGIVSSRRHARTHTDTKHQQHTRTASQSFTRIRKVTISNERRRLCCVLYYLRCIKCVRFAHITDAVVELAVLYARTVRINSSFSADKYNVKQLTHFGKITNDCFKFI